MKNTFVLVAVLTLLLGSGLTAYGGPTNTGLHEVPLLKQVDVPIIADGKQIGSMKLAPGSLVSVVSVQADGIMVTRGEGTPFKVSKDVIAPDALTSTLATPTPQPVAIPVQATPSPTPPSSNQAANTASPTPTNKPAIDPKLAEWDAGPIKGALLDIARFRWWAPSGIKNLRGVMVLIPGRNGDGRGLTGDKNWQQFATDMQLALVGCNFYGEKDHFTYQHDPTGDVAKAINEAVEKLAIQNGYTDLKSPALVFWGHSAGSIVSQAYLKRYPERVLAAVNLKGPVGPGETTPAKNAIPYLIVVGAKDKPDWVKGALANYETGKKGGAVWTLALSPNEGHEGGKSQPLMLAFLRSVLNQRLGPVISNQNSFASSSSPKRLSNSEGWLGDTSTYDIGAQSNFHGTRSTATWLPDETTAKEWQAFLRGN